MAEDRSRITDASGRHIPVVRARIVREIPEDAAPPVEAIDVRAKLQAIGSRVRRLTVSRVDPEAFHVERSAISRELDLLASMLPAHLANVTPPRERR